MRAIARCPRWCPVMAAAQRLVDPVGEQAEQCGVRAQGRP